MKTLRTELADGVMQVALARQQVLNAINSDMRSEMGTVLAEAARDDNVKAIVVLGDGRAFCTGADMQESEAFTRYSASQWLEEMNQYRKFVLSLWLHPKPTIAAVHGYCLGGGMDLALACDLTVASEDALFGMPEVTNGAGLPLLVLPWLAGPKVAKEIILTGRINAPAASLAKHGLLNDVLPEGRHVEGALRLAAEIVKAPSLAVRYAKEAINRSYHVRGMQEALEAEAYVAVALEMAETPERRTFNEIRQRSGLKAALAWRAQR